MFNFYDLCVFLLGIGLLAYWWRISGQKTRALLSAKNHCKHVGLQLLDQTLEFKKYRFAQDNQGQTRLCRVYEFDFCTDGEQRYNGEIMLAGFTTLRIVVETDQVEVTEF